MADPIAKLRVYNPVDLFGEVTSVPQSVTWDLGAAGVTLSGLCHDPTGDYWMQAPQDVWLPADETQWTFNGGTYGRGTDEVTGVSYLRQTDPAATFDATFKTAFADDAGFRLLIPRFAPPPTSGGAAVNPSLVHFFVSLNDGHTSQADGWRLAVEPGQPIRLQRQPAGTSTWADVAQAGTLGESEAYLNQCSPPRWLMVDVLPQTDPSWYAAAANGNAGDIARGGPPPNRLVITLGRGDAVLTVPMTAFAGGKVRITGAQGQWGCRVARKLFLPNPSADLPAQVRPDPFTGTPIGFVTGHLPYDGPPATSGGPPTSMATVAVAAQDASAPPDTDAEQDLPANQASATLTVTTPAAGQVVVNNVTYAAKSCYLSAVEAVWPAIQTPPNPDAPYVEYTAIYAECTAEYSQGWVRRRATCVFQTIQNTFAPGNVIPAVRGAVLLMGDVSDPALTPVLTGYTALARLDGQQWAWVDWQKHFAVSVEDRHRKGEEDQTACLHCAPYDFEAFYTPVREMHHRIGVTDDWMTGFPHVLRGGQMADGSGPFTGYYLGGGTTREPLHQPAPDDSVNPFLERLRADAGEVDAVSGQIQPIVLGTTPLGEIICNPLPAGIASAFLTPGQTLAQLGLASVADYRLADFRAGGLRTTATLSHVRTPVVLEGLDWTTGEVIVGVAANEKLGAGPDADPTVPGYVGTRVPYVAISRLYSSPAVVALAAQVAAVSLAAPGVGAEGELLGLVPAQDVMQVITITDPYTMGSGGPVPFWTWRVLHVVDRRDPARHDGHTQIGSRLVGQPAEAG
ncbi:MAG: hypothetical protein JO250_12400 [Armatimonadetes bacterium]|nr:hypothetical protein [Armatimonadota bacterium]